jgi:dihydrofolate reductase
MRKIILNLAVSLDNYIEGPNGEYDWCFTDQDYGLNDFFAQVDTIIYGRKSYELFGSYVPSEDASENEKELMNKMMQMKKYVFSTTMEPAEGVTIVKGNVEEEVYKIKHQPGKDIFLFGGASLITSFQNLNLIDEYQLAVHPLILGAGLPLFKDINTRKYLKLRDTKVFSTGLVILYYEAVRDEGQ